MGVVQNVACRCPLCDEEFEECFRTHEPADYWQRLDYTPIKWALWADGNEVECPRCNAPLEVYIDQPMPSRYVRCDLRVKGWPRS